MSVIVVTPPNEEPIELEAAKLWLRKNASEAVEDDQIRELITGAREFFEEETERTLITTELRLELEQFPFGAISLPRPPLLAVTAIKYIDADGNQQTLATGKYQVDSTRQPGRVAPAYGETWPDVRPGYGAVKIEYNAGYGAAAAVPKNIISAIKQIMVHRDINREAVVTGTIATELPMGAQRVIDQYRVYSV